LGLGPFCPKHARITAIIFYFVFFNWKFGRTPGYLIEGANASSSARETGKGKTMSPTADMTPG